MPNSPSVKYRDVAVGPVVELPPGYPAYCIYVPTGMNEEFERQVSEKLQEWGKNMGKNLYVAPWNIGDPSYIELMRRIEFKNRPAIILTDSNNPDKDSFKIVLDDPLIARDVSKLKGILPSILDLILVQENHTATKKYLSEQQKAKIRSLLDSLGSALSKVKLTFSWQGITLQV
jgi:hypothetical protein